MHAEEKAFNAIAKSAKEMMLFKSCALLLEWDQETYMPAEGDQLRSEQNKLIHGMVHKQKVSKGFANKLEKLIDIKSGHLKAKHLSEEKQAALKNMRHDYLLETKLTSKLVEKFSDATTHALQGWKSAKSKNSFKEFAPHLTKIIDLTKKKADLLGYEEHPYNAMLDLYEPGVTVKTLDETFKGLKKGLIPILQRAQKQEEPPHAFLKGHFPKAAQEELCKEVLQAMGLQESRYGLHTSAHPFCLGLSPKDIRLTTHFHESDFLKSLFGAIHEGGHGLYEQGLPDEMLGTPLSEPASYGIHESQSRIWETFIGHSRAFWKFLLPKAQKLFPSLEGVTLDQFYAAINRPRASLIRIFADEVTYNLHIILRYELEKAFFDPSFKVKELPEMWNALMKELLGITPPTDSEGCLQDIHWALAYIGYFPSYSLGNIYAGSLYNRLIKTHSDYETRIANGDFKFINKFLETTIYAHGRTYPPLDLIARATTTPLTTTPYLTYLDAKY